MPLVFSNPRLFPRPERAMPSSRTSICCRRWPPSSTRRQAARADWQGVDYSGHCVRDPAAGAGAGRVVFTYDDVRCAQNVVQLVPPPNRIVSIREARYKLARYYDGDGIEPDQWEMYDLDDGPRGAREPGLPWPHPHRRTIRRARAIDREAAGRGGHPTATAVGSQHRTRSGRARR